MTEQGGPIRVDRFAAFRVNGLWSRAGSLPFPLSFAVSSADGVHCVDAAAASVSELVDLFAAYARGHAVVLNVGTNSWPADDHRQAPLERIAREQGVDVDVHDIRWAVARYASGDLLVMPWARMARFLDGWYPYDIEILDVAEPLTPTRVEELALAVNTHDLRTGPLVPQAPGAGLYFNGHDDCYVYVETTSAGFAPRLLARLLALRAGAGLLDERDAEGEDTEVAVTVTQPPVALAAELLGIAGTWVGKVAQVCPGERVTLALAPTAARWRLGQALPEVMPHEVTLDLVTGGWSHHVSGMTGR
ncbi:hypothetical protein ACFQZ4_41540 [Catellatospora coxensis]|uniref:Uncharacterized protein n=1 Tax=Catellatospora coxensis TaxID=310354 RepID=A0A8J3PB56_9ACTN|nr:hypothetical protein [Catellatospora coxensis]GIG08546.1 hypothetical protein Cco03nite_52460 [Catellatospora coxensis]